MIITRSPESLSSQRSRSPSYQTAPMVVGVKAGRVGTSQEAIRQKVKGLRMDRESSPLSLNKSQRNLRVLKGIEREMVEANVPVPFKTLLANISPPKETLKNPSFIAIDPKSIKEPTPSKKILTRQPFSQVSLNKFPSSSEGYRISLPKKRNKVFK